MPRKPTSAVFPDGPWLIVSAWAPELARLKSARARLGPNRRCVVVGTVGIGLVEAAVGASHLIATHQPRAVLLIGTAGVYPAHRRELAVGSAVAVEETVLLPTARPGSHAFLPALVPNRQRSSTGLLGRVVHATQLPTAHVACPVAISASVRMAHTAARHSGCALENLEAFAVARAATAAHVPFAAILGVANVVGPDGHREWKRNASQAAAAACRAALDFLTASDRGD